jgi:hypothetical protein
MEKIKGIIIVENTIIFAEYQNDKRRVTCKNMKRNGLNGSHVVCRGFRITIYHIDIDRPDPCNQANGIDFVL